MATHEETRTTPSRIGHVVIDGHEVPVTTKTDPYDGLDSDNCPHGKPWEDNCEQCNEEDEFAEDRDVGEPYGAFDERCAHEVPFTEECAECTKDAADINVSLDRIF